MSSVSFPAIATPTAPLVPFCDKRFQMLRVLVSRIGYASIAVILKVAAFFVSICSKKTSDHFRSLAIYYQERSASFSTFSLYGGKIIDFSVDMGRPKMSHQENGLNALRNIYGNEAIAHWSTIASPAAPLSQDKLKFENDGCCFGMSLDFISRYYKELQKDKTPLEAVKTIAPIYADGATPEAELAQIFNDAIDLSLFHSRRDALRQETLRLRQLPSSDLIISRRSAINAELGQLIQGAVRVKAAAVAQKMGLSMGLTNDIKLKNQQMDSTIQQFINNLNPGVYEARLCSNIKDTVIVHSTVFIKTDAGCFIFAPNFGTFTFTQEEAAKELLLLSQKYGFDSALFRPITRSEIQ